MSRHGKRFRAGKSASARNRVAKSEWLEPRTMMSGVSLVLASTPEPGAAPTVAHPISASGSETVTGKTASLCVLGSDAEGASNLSYDWSVSSAPSGGSATFSANNNNAAANTTMTFTKAGAYHVTVKIIDEAGKSVTNSVVVNVSATLTSVKITTPSGGAVSSTAALSVSGTSQELVAQGLDQFGNVLAAQPTFKWSTTSTPGGAAAPGISASGSAATFTFKDAGAYVESVQAVAGGVTVTAKAALNVAAKPSYVTVSQVGGSATVTGTTAEFTVSQLEDQFHDAISGSTKITWTTTTRPAGAGLPTFSVSGSTTTVTFKQAGQYVLTATETNSAGVSVSASITVSVAQHATGLASQLAASTSVTGTSEKLTDPTVVDQFGYVMASQPGLVWSATALPSGAAAPTFLTSSGSTTVTFSSAGSYTLTAEVSGATNIKYVVAANVAQTLTSIAVTPGAASISEGATEQFSAQARDQFQHAMATQPTFAWSASGGSISTSGLFTAPESAASYTVTAKDGSVLSGSVSITVQAPAGQLQNAYLNTLVQSLDADGSISRDDMIEILDAVAAKGTVTASELSDLKQIINDAASLDMAGYVQQLASDVVDGNAANATYLGQTLGNLAVGSSAAQLTDLVDKWFLGTDLPTLTDSSYVYKTVSGSLFPTTPSIANEFQGELGDCYFISSLGTIADQDPAAIEDMFINNGDGTYTVRFYGGTYGSTYNSSNGTYSDGFTNGVGTPEYVTVNLQLPTTATGMLVYADYGAAYNNAANSLWIPLLEKAYAEWNQTGQEGRDGQNAYASIEGGWMATVDAQVLGHNATDYIMGVATEQQLISALSSGYAVTIGTINTEYGLYGSHAYAVTGYNASSNTFTLYNPWGFDQPGPLTWSELESDTSAFTVTNAAGPTPISGAVAAGVESGIESAAPSAPSATAGGSSIAAIEQFFQRGGSLSGNDESQDAAQGSAAGSSLAGIASANSSAATRAAVADALCGGAALGDFDSDSGSLLSSLSGPAFHAGDLSDASAASIDLFYGAMETEGVLNPGWRLA